MGNGLRRKAARPSKRSIRPPRKRLLRLLKAIRRTSSWRFAARKALESGPWSRMDVRDRGRLMMKLADLIEHEADELAALETLDNGKPIRDAAQCRRSVDDRLPAILRWICGQDPRSDDSDSRELLLLHAARTGGGRRPDHPLELPDADGRLEVGAGIAAGCTVVMKPAEQTPLTCLRLARLAQKAGIPDGVINVVPGFGPTAGAAIVKHPGVDKVAFTGEYLTAQTIMKDAAPTLKRLTFELGGKSPNIITADADLDAAAAGTTLDSTSTRANAAARVVASSWRNRCMPDSSRSWQA